MQGQIVYNQDVAHVGPPAALGDRTPSSSSSRHLRARGPVPPPHQWVMVMESNFRNSTGHEFAVSNSSDPTDPASWVGLDQADFFIDAVTPSGKKVDGCPSIRFDAATGYYYVLAGGYEIFLVRSQTLARGSWELANVTDSSIIVPDAQDCIKAGAPYGGWYEPSALAQSYLSNCTNGLPPFNKGVGFGDDSDVDLAEVLVGPQECAGFEASGVLARSPGMAALCQQVVGSGAPGFATLFQYGSGNQHTFGFSNLAIAPGRLFDVLGGYFATPSSPQGEPETASSAPAAPPFGLRHSVH
jgi:hypothetical protein